MDAKRAQEISASQVKASVSFNGEPFILNMLIKATDR